ncbi:hypothetical protein MTR67_044421 [Solanum verrucosum]|uniref:DUF4218 domain-containing protein n=1 Tax=Solanum verrucosum TaxID=315347 RepID=A0AAF0UTC1_SOLVR|nr:hypothetical protein MTR67_044421 [Solanum verrucosum]
MAKNIIVSSNKLEKILPPGFFDVMEHLPIHLVHEALLGGPVQYRWMYPFERYFVCQYGHDQVFPSFIMWYNNWNVKQVYYAPYPLSRDMSDWWVVIKTKLMGRVEVENELHVAYQNEISSVHQVVDAELEMNLEHPDHILEEVNREELDMPTNMEEDREETFKEDEWIDEEETSEDDACEWIDDEETSEEDEKQFGYSHLGRGSTIPSASASQCNSLNTSSGSIGLSNLHLESNGSEPNTPTTQHSDAHGPQPGDRDNFQRLVIEPLGYNLRPDVGMAKIILKCIKTHYNGVYPNWSSIPVNTQGQMFNEFKKYYVWAPEHEDDVQVNFKLKASKLLSSIFCDCRRENKIPKFMLPDRWALLLKHWSTKENFKKRSEIGKMARASEKGGSLHTGGAISQVGISENTDLRRSIFVGRFHTTRSGTETPGSQPSTNS